MGHLNERLERAMGSVKVEAKKPYVLRFGEEANLVNAELHEEVAKSANVVLHALDALSKVVKKAAEKTGAGTFSETRTIVEKMKDEMVIAQIAIDHTRWANSIRDTLS